MRFRQSWWKHLESILFATISIAWSQNSVIGATKPPPSLPIIRVGDVMNTSTCTIASRLNNTATLMNLMGGGGMFGVAGSGDILPRRGGKLQDEVEIRSQLMDSIGSKSDKKQQQQATVYLKGGEGMKGLSKGQNQRFSKRQSKEASNQADKKAQTAEGEETTQAKLAKMEKACRSILECIGEEPTREGLVKTPRRWAEALLFMTNGYKASVQQVTNDAIFSENHQEMVVIRDIHVHSLCEHHMLPFTGKVHVAYIPDGRVLGLSKIARIADVFARRLQVQERMTSQIADAIVEAISPLGVAVVVECSHFCMVMRGVQKTSAVTVTSAVRGRFKNCSKTRAEFFSILNSNPH